MELRHNCRLWYLICLRGTFNYDKVKHELRVTSTELRAESLKARVDSLKARVKI